MSTEMGFLLIKVVAFLVAGLFFYFGWKISDKLAEIDFKGTPNFKDHREKKSYEGMIQSKEVGARVCYTIGGLATALLFLLLAIGL